MNTQTHQLPQPVFSLALLRRHALFLILLLLIAGFASKEPAFVQPANLLSILQSTSVEALLGLAVTVALIAGGFDLSIGATASTALIASSYAMVVWHWGAVPTVLFGLLSGAAIGLFNALLVVRLRIPDLLATLGTMFLLGGLQLIPTGGQSISTGLMLPDGSSASGTFAPGFLALGRARLLGVPVPVIIVAVIALALWLLMQRTRWGRVFYATGGNEQAAALAGAPTARYRTLAYVLSGTLAALGGVIIAARVGRGDVSGGGSLLLDSVGATLIGFAVLNARRPHIVGTVVGALFVGVLLNGLTMLNVPFYTQDFVKGLVLVGALALTFGPGRGRA
ncbi:simple sugar transport system permease protein [Silvimonas terrae]|uniref:Simple sugar transport system permease protein n=1 Tax=Silvimonas terrae TaxID=300266 RepID=A0A840RF89_9NEIS|nr:ABC transporter permease [Silvimonas terrae]MBB5191178.1 simple sugar transport system permease protein [Silvimonas terrae]